MCTITEQFVPSLVIIQGKLNKAYIMCMADLTNYAGVFCFHAGLYTKFLTGAANSMVLNYGTVTEAGGGLAGHPPYKLQV